MRHAVADKPNFNRNRDLQTIRVNREPKFATTDKNRVVTAHFMNVCTSLHIAAHFLALIFPIPSTVRRDRRF